MRDNFRSKFEAADDQYIRIKTATIVLNDTRAAGVLLDGLAPIRLEIPSGWAGTATRVRVRLSQDGTTYRPLYDDAGNEKAIVVAASRAIALDPSEFCGVTYLQIRGTQATGTAAAQLTTACIVSIIARLV